MSPRRWAARAAGARTWPRQEARTPRPCPRPSPRSRSGSSSVYSVAGAPGRGEGASMDWSLGIVIAVAVGVMLVFRKAINATQANLKKAQEETAGRMEALFSASFPELQPHFHPARVLEYVRARRARVPSGSPTTWRKPPGFPAADHAEIVLEGMKDNVRLVGPAGAPVAKFVYEEHPEGGVIRFGKGKFTVNLKGTEPRVRYWHPEREFKWTPSSWKIKSALADQALASRSSRDDDSWSDSSSSSSSRDRKSVV